MSKTKISEFSTTPGNNTDINGINIAEGCAPSGINNAIRELMSDLKEWQSGAMDVYVIPQGTAAAPGIQLYGDLDTGLYGFAANQLGVAVGGASAGYFSSDGWVGNVVATTVDLTNIEVTNIKAKDGTAAITIADSTGIVSVSTVLDLTTIEVTNIKAKDGTASASIADSTGAITVTKDLTANGVTLGKGLGSVLTNTALGRSALAANTVGDLNTAVGNLSLTSNTGGTGNTAVGHVAMTSHQGGSLNTAVGAGSLTANLNGNNNTAIGQSALGTATGSNNTAVGSAAGSLITNGNKNTIIGNYDGNQGGLDIRTASNYIVLSDGDGNPRAYWNGANATFGGSLTATTITGTQVNSDNLRLDGNTLSSTDTNGNIVVTPNGTGITTFSNYLKTGNLEVGQVALGTNLIKATNTNGGIYLQTNGTGLIFADAESIIAGNASATTKITTNGASDLVLDTNDGSNSGSITIEDGVNGNIIIAPNGTGQVQITNAALDLTTIEVTNIKAKDGTASITLADSTGNVTVSPAFAVNGNTTLGDASTDTVTVNGYMGIGGAPGASTAITVAPTALTGTLQYGVSAQPTGTSAATNSIIAFDAFPQVANAVFTVNNVYGLSVRSGSKGASATATNWHGIQVADQTQGTNNYGITSLVSSGTNKWNIYASGTAANYFAGNVGIGNSNPTARLEVVTSSGTATAKIWSATNTTPIADLELQRGTNATWGADVYGDYRIRNDAGVLLFQYGESSTTTERMRIDSSGNLGLGVTPSAWNSNSKAIEIGEATAIEDFAVGGANPSIIFNNAYRNTSNAFIYKVSDEASYYGQYQGAHSWYTAPSGTAGNAITFTERANIGTSEMVVNDSGNDYDFRVESDTSTHAFFVQGSDGNVGIGDSAVAYKLVVKDAAESNATAFKPVVNLLGTYGSSNRNHGLGFSINTNPPSAGIYVSELGAAGSNLIFTNSVSYITATQLERFKLGVTEAVFNDPGNDYDFRVASDTNTHALFVQGSDGNVGIGTSSPSNYSSTTSPALTVVGAVTSTNGLINSWDSTTGGGADVGGNIAFGGNDGSVANRTFAAIKGGKENGTSGNYASYLGFYTRANGGATTERARITSGGNFQTSSGGSVQVGGTAARATTAGTNRLDIFDGTAPVGTLANGVSFYSTAGEARVMDAAGNATLLSPHDTDTNEWIFHSKHTPTGKVLKIDVERLLKFVNDHFGLDAVHEFIEE